MVQWWGSSEGVFLGKVTFEFRFLACVRVWPRKGKRHSKKREKCTTEAWVWWHDRERNYGWSVGSGKRVVDDIGDWKSHVLESSVGK